MSLCMLSSRPIAGRDTSRAEEKVHPGVDTTPPNGRGVRERGVALYTGSTVTLRGWSSLFRVDGSINAVTMRSIVCQQCNFLL